MKVIFNNNSINYIITCVFCKQYTYLYVFIYRMTSSIASINSFCYVALKLHIVFLYSSNSLI